MQFLVALEIFRSTTSKMSYSTFSKRKTTTILCREIYSSSICRTSKKAFDRLLLEFQLSNTVQSDYKFYFPEYVHYSISIETETSIVSIDCDSLIPQTRNQFTLDSQQFMHQLFSLFRMHIIFAHDCRSLQFSEPYVLDFRNDERRARNVVQI